MAMFLKSMVLQSFTVAAGLMLVMGASVGAAEARTDVQVLHEVMSIVRGHPHLTIFDDVDATVSDGVVTLAGKVTMPDKRDEIAHRVARIDGVRRVVDRIDVLPPSPTDDQLRRRIARSIYGNSNFWSYAAMANPPIHIIVEHSRVTLTGVVKSDVDRVLARSLAAQFGALSVTNDLKTAGEGSIVPARPFQVGEAAR
jgi:osmotically-inducible protein OsmY